MRKQHRWIRQQLICCFIHTYTRTHHLPPTVREIGAWVGCPGMLSLQLALADLEWQQYLTRQSHAQRSIVLTAKGIALAQRWQLFIPVAGAEAQTWQALGAAS
jgi:SOS-response transcriptional repressor LexA